MILDFTYPLRSVYSHVRHRIQNLEIDDLDEEIKNFNYKASNMDIMLAVLTSTHPVKHLLRHRADLFKNIKRELKNRGQLEKGVLDGLK